LKIKERLARNRNWTTYGNLRQFGVLFRYPAINEETMRASWHEDWKWKRGMGAL